MNYVVGFIDKLGVLGRTCVVSCFEEVEQVLWILYDQNGDVNDLIIAKGKTLIVGMSEKVLTPLKRELILLEL